MSVLTTEVGKTTLITNQQLHPDPRSSLTPSLAYFPHPCGSGDAESISASFLSHGLARPSQPSHLPLSKIFLHQLQSWNQWIVWNITQQMRSKLISVKLNKRKEFAQLTCFNINLQYIILLLIFKPVRSASNPSLITFSWLTGTVAGAQQETLIQGDAY